VEKNIFPFRLLQLFLNKPNNILKQEITWKYGVIESDNGRFFVVLQIEI
jgi:hypothetical protein